LKRTHEFNNRNKKSGITFLEILIGLFILALVSIIYSQVMQSTRKELNCSSEHFTAILLSQKLMQDLSQENILDPVFGFQYLGLDDPSPVPQKIVDGESIFFSYIEDRMAPWQQIDPTKDGMIDKTMVPLYSQLQPFQLQLNAHRVAPASDPSMNRHLWLSTAEWSWVTSNGPGAYQLQCMFASPIGPKQVELERKFDTAQIEKETSKFFFGEPLKTLQEIVKEKGGDYDTIFALGKIQFVSAGYEGATGIGKLLKEIEILEKQEKTIGKELPEKKCPFYKQLAEKYLDIARLSFLLIFNMEPLATRAVSQYDERHLGTELWKSRRLAARGIRGLKTGKTNFVSSLVLARSKYEKLVTSKDLAMYMGNKRTYQIFFRLGDLYRILAVIPEYSSGKKEYQEFLQRLKSFSDGRDPSLNRFVVNSMKSVDDTSELCKTYSTLGLIYELLVSKMLPIEDFIKQYLGGA